MAGASDGATRNMNVQRWKVYMICVAALRAEGVH
jgi:hypothetical protein